jgi:hypothetical protein
MTHVLGHAGLGLDGTVLPRVGRVPHVPIWRAGFT